MVPENCNECPHTKTCVASYGVPGCAFEGQILLKYRGLEIKKKENNNKN